MLDIVLRGGQVVTPSGVGTWDVGIQGGKVVAVAVPDTLPADVERVVDATGKIIVPGGIDPHVHSGWPDPLKAVSKGAPKKQASVDVMTRACVFGGTTTVIDFARSLPEVDLLQAIEARNQDYGGKSHTDYSYHVGLFHPEGGPPTRIIEQTKEVIAAGFPSIKVFMTNASIGRATQMTDLGHVSGIMEETAAHGGILMVHAEDDELVMYMLHKLRDENRYDLEYMPVAHSNMSEDISCRRVIRLAEWLGGAVYVAHISAREAVQAVAESRVKGLPIYGETIVNYMTHTQEVYKTPEGPLYHTTPSLKSEEDRLALWRGLIEGSLSTVATDENFVGRAAKIRGRTLQDTTGGCESVEPRMGIVYTDGVVKGGMSLERFVEVTSSNAAKILGMYPQKGAIAPGSDADITLIDPGIHKRLSLTDLHGDDYSIFDGREIHGWPVMTILRGKIIVENGQLLGKPGDGRLVPRKIAPEVLKRPVC